MKKLFKTGMSLVLATTMFVSALPQMNLVYAATTKEEQTVVTEEVDYNALNDEIYDNLEDYPVGDMEKMELVPEDTVCVKDAQEYYEAVEENAPTALSEEIEPTASLPSAVDNSTNENAKYFPPIASQIGGSCTCYAFIYNLGSYTLNKARGTDASLKSNQLNPLFVYNMTRSTYSTGTGTGCDDAITVITKVGVPAADVAPITSGYKNYQYTWYPTESIWNSAASHRVGTAIKLKDIDWWGTPITDNKDSDLDLIKTTLSSGNILAFATAFYTFNYTVIPNDSESHPGEHAVDRCDRYVSSGSSRNWGGHAMAIVGYDDNIWIDINRDGKKQTGEFGALKIANSHGTWYKNDGFVWVAYDAINKVSSVITTEDENRVNAAIDNGTMSGNKISSKDRVEFFWYNNYLYTYSASTDASETSHCNLVTNLNTSKRQDVRMKITATEKSTGEVSVYNVEPFGITHWTYDYALDGSTDSTDGTIVTDLNNVVSDITKDTVENYKWQVEITDNTASSEPLTVKNLQIKVDGNVYLQAENINNDTLNGTSKTYELKKGFIKDFTVSKTSPISLTDAITLSATVNGDSSNYEYRFGTIFKGKEYYFGYGDGFSTSSSENVSGLTHLISDGDGSGTAEAVGTHTLFVDVKDKTTKAVERKTINNYEVKGLKITSFTTNVKSPQKVGTTIQLNAEVEYEALYRYNEYRFSVVKDGVETKLNTYGKYSVSWTPKESGNYKLKYYIRDYLGQEATATIDYVIKPESQKSVIYYKNDSYAQAYIHYQVKDGSWTAVPGVKMEKTSEIDGYNWKYEIDLGEKELAYVCFNNGSGNWDSKNGSNYTVQAGVMGIKNGNVTPITITPTNKPTATPTNKPTVTPTNKPTATPTGKPTATPTNKPTVTPTPVGKKLATVYYSNKNYNQAYIHFKTNNGSWTAAPGIKMDDNTSNNGYTWKYVIDLDNADGATVCFNNGNGSWDSKNGSNYSVGVGSYGIQNGTVEKLQEGMTVSLTANKAVGGIFNEAKFTAQANGGTEPYTYKFAIVNKGNIPGQYSYYNGNGNSYSYVPYTAGDYDIYVKATDANGKEAVTYISYTIEGSKWGSFTATAADHKVGTPVTLEAEYINVKPDSYNRYSFQIAKDGEEETIGTGSVGKLVWTPKEAGTYVITAQFHHYTGSVMETSMEYTVSEGNTAMVYYNTSWSNAYIHYSIDGGKTWTALPGVAMEKCSDKSGYTFKYAIDLEDYSNAIICFNNGNGSWDSRNGNNYNVQTGVFGISNGNVVNLQ